MRDFDSFVAKEKHYNTQSLCFSFTFSSFGRRMFTMAQSTKPLHFNFLLAGWGGCLLFECWTSPLILPVFPKVFALDWIIPLQKHIISRAHVYISVEFL